jgi:hypothetical protein
MPVPTHYSIFRVETAGYTKKYYRELINIYILGFSNKNGDYGGASYYGSYFYQSGNPYRSEKHNGQFVLLRNDKCSL